MFSVGFVERSSGACEIRGGVCAEEEEEEEGDRGQMKQKWRVFLFSECR